MPRTIHMAAFIPAPPEKLFDMYLDPKFHAAITGSPAAANRSQGSSLSRRGPRRIFSSRSA